MAHPYGLNGAGRASAAARFGVAALLVLSAVLVVIGGGAAAQESAPVEQWEGPYYCSQGVTQMTLTVLERDGENVVAEYLFFADPANPAVPTGCYLVEGRLTPGPDGIDLRPKEWIERPGDNWLMVPLSGEWRADGHLQGWINTVGCGGFRLEPLEPGQSAAPTCQLLIG